jgi:hypothetical protein
MGVSRQVLREGNKKDFPKPGDTVSIEYTGYLYDPSREDKKGKKYVLALLLSLLEIIHSGGGRMLARPDMPLTLFPPCHCRFDSSVGRGDFVTRIGRGQVIKGTVSCYLSRPYNMAFSTASYDRRLGRRCAGNVGRGEVNSHDYIVSSHLPLCPVTICPIRSVSIRPLIVCKANCDFIKQGLRLR